MTQGNKQQKQTSQDDKNCMETDFFSSGDLNRGFGLHVFFAFFRK